jgi:hypothetical protein
MIKNNIPLLRAFESLVNVRWLHAGTASAGPGATSRLPADTLTLADFISRQRSLGDAQNSAATNDVAAPPAAAGRRFYIETYGCQMNTSDSEIVSSVLLQAGYAAATGPDGANIVLLNTCAIRENAEAKIWQRLGHFKNLRRAAARRDRNSSAAGPAASSGPAVVGVLGCMAERLKHRLLDSDKMVDLVAGPDAYRDLPRLIDIASGAGTAPEELDADGSDDRASSPASAINVQLSAEETYADVAPVRPSGAVSAFLSIMRGCNNMCSFCIVPRVRGRERSRPAGSILDEVGQHPFSIPPIEYMWTAAWCPYSALPGNLEVN